MLWVRWQHHMNSNIKMMGSLCLDSEDVETTWIYFHFHQTSPGWIVTAYCEPRRRSAMQTITGRYAKRMQWCWVEPQGHDDFSRSAPTFIHTHFLLCVPPLLLCIVAAWQVALRHSQPLSNWIWICYCRASSIHWCMPSCGLRQCSYRASHVLHLLMCRCGSKLPRLDVMQYVHEVACSQMFAQHWFHVGK